MSDKIIVFGASGFLGSCLYKYFKYQGREVIGTYFNSKKEGLVKFDLSEPNLESIDVSDVKYAVITSAITSVGECYKYPERSYKINVEGTKSLIKQLWKRGIFPIWFSSDYVFDGNKGNYNETDETNPCNIYGEHKKEVEDFFLSSGKDFLILRTCKLYSVKEKDDSIIWEIARKLKNDKEIYCFSDQIMSFTDVRDLVRCLDLMIEKSLRGLYNVVAPEFFSRVDFARLVKERMGINSGEIVAGSVDRLDLPFKIPKNITLDSGKLREAIDFEFRKVGESLDEMVGENNFDKS